MRAAAREERASPLEEPAPRPEGAPAEGAPAEGMPALQPEGASAEGAAAP